MSRLVKATQRTDEKEIEIKADNCEVNGGVCAHAFLGEKMDIEKVKFCHHYQCFKGGHSKCSLPNSVRFIYGSK